MTLAQGHNHEPGDDESGDDADGPGTNGQDVTGATPEDAGDGFEDGPRAMRAASQFLCLVFCYLAPCWVARRSCSNQRDTERRTLAATQQATLKAAQESMASMDPNMMKTAMDSGQFDRGLDQVVSAAGLS